MSHSLDIERLRQMDALHSSGVAKQMAQSPAPSSPHKELYGKLFRPDLNSILLTNGVYYVRITREKIDYREEDSNGSRQTTYAFDTGKIISSGNEQDSAFLEKFFAKLRSISAEIETGKAQVFEEPREG